MVVKLLKTTLLCLSLGWVLLQPIPVYAMPKENKTDKLNADLTQEDLKIILPIIRDRGQGDSWENFIFDIIVLDSKRRQVSIFPNGNHFEYTKKRIIMTASSVGQSSDGNSAGAGFGLWLEKSLNLPQAMAIISIIWPIVEAGELGHPPIDLEELRLDKVGLSCNPWARVLVSERRGSLKKLAKNMKNFDTLTYVENKADVRFRKKPYALGNTIILPITIMLKGNNFYSVCISDIQ